MSLRRKFTVSCLAGVTMLMQGCLAPSYGVRDSGPVERCVQSGLGGALLGAGIGALVDGGKGAKKGAYIGGSAGCVGGALNTQSQRYGNNGYGNNGYNNRHSRNGNGYGNDQHRGGHNHNGLIPQRYQDGSVCWFEDRGRGRAAPVLNHCD